MPDSIKDFRSRSSRVLRYVAARMLRTPTGCFAVWGAPGSAKTMFLQVIVAGMAKRGVEARYITAADIERRIWDQIHAGQGVGLDEFLRIPVLAIDELANVKWRTPVIQTELIAFIDARHRMGIEGTAVTLYATQYDPTGDRDDAANVANVIPEMVVSRWHDGRYSIPWDEASLGEPTPEFATDPYGTGEWMIRSVLHCDQPDARPFQRPQTGDIERLRAAA